MVVSGGTAHGIGLRRRPATLSLRSRAATLARGGLDAAGFVRSPFSIDGKQRLFAEPPHMQASMLLPARRRVEPPAVGDELDVRVRFTATDVDRGPDQLSEAPADGSGEATGASDASAWSTGSRQGRSTSRATTATSHSSASTRTTIATQ